MYLEEWCQEYGVPPDRIDYAFERIQANQLGYTRFKWDRANRIAEIRINSVIQDFPITVKTVTWHEFAHAEKWILDGDNDGHGINWVRRLCRKPFLAFYDLLPAKIVFEIAKRQSSKYDNRRTQL